MRLPFWTGALLALLLVSHPAERQGSSGPVPQPAARSAEPEVAVEWTDVPEPATDAAVWRSGYRISNRGGAPTGPLQLRVRTPLGLLSQPQVTSSLAVGEILAGTVEVQIAPGLSELCIEVRAVDGERALPELDTSDNRVCRRPSRPERLRAAAAAILPSENTP
jgi:hypothetical protein